MLYRGCRTLRSRKRGGAKLALLLLLRTKAPLRQARTIGDNLNVVRYGAERGAVRNPDIHGPMADALASAAEQGWALKWRAVRRRLNKAADEVATAAVHRAHVLRARGAVDPEVVFDAP